MKRVIWLLACAALISSTSAPAKKVEGPIDPGPRPTDQEFVEKTTQSLLSSFFDPSAAIVEWPNGLAGGWWKPIFSKKIPGWFTCGRVNGKNRMGGYVGFHSFVAVMHDGAVAYTEVGSGNYDLVESQCQKALASGLLPAGPLVTKAASEPAPAVLAAPASGFAPLLGFQFSDDASGVRIDAITPGSVAEAAGLARGAVIQQVNGVALGTLDFGTKSKLFEAADAGATLSMSDGTAVLMKRPALPPRRNVSSPVKKSRR
jgi:hypothetical protein